MAEFQLVVNGILETYTKYEDIPDTFENVIKFLPDLPEPEGEDGNHTDEQHNDGDDDDDDYVVVMILWW